MTVVVALGAGLLAGRLLWIMARPLFARPPFLHDNHRGRLVPTGTGVVLALAVVLVEAGRAVAGAAGIGNATAADAIRQSAVVTCLGLGLVGLVDDLAGSADRRGLRGHLAALGRGQLTSGAAKLVGGGAIALFVAATVDIARASTARASEGVGARSAVSISLAHLVADAALIALAANLGNLLDVAPGRAIKGGIVSFAALAFGTGASAAMVGPAVAVGASVGLLREDLHERLMLGDAGANVLGGMLGLGVVATCGWGTRVVVVITLGTATLLSEVVSFSRVIDSVAPLRALDRAGRLPG